MSCKIKPILLFAFVLLVYILTLSPTINSFDSAEFITGAYTLGIVHAPGYPLYLLLAHLLIHTFNFSAPVIVNFLSAFFAALCVIVVYKISLHLSRSNLWSATSAMMLAFSSLFWSKALIAEVYSLGGLFVALLFLIFVLFSASASYQYLFLFFFIAGLSLTHHTSVVLILPWFFIGILFFSAKKIDVSKLLISFLFFLAPLTLYIYFPIRSAANPSLDYVRKYFGFIDLNTFKGVYWMASGQMFNEEMWGRPFGETVLQFLNLLTDLWLNFFGIGLILALIAIFSYIRKIKIIGITVFMSVLTILIFFSAYNVVDSQEMILPVLVLLAPFISVGGASLEKHINILPQVVAKNKLLIFVYFVALSMLIVNWRSVDRSYDWLAHKYSELVLEMVEPNSLIIAQWTTATPLEYMIIVEGRRSDVEIFDRGLYYLGARAKFLDCKKNNNMSTCSYLNEDTLQKHINNQLSIRPVYITEYDPLLLRDFCLIDEVLVYRVLPLQACE
jgi:hypothetical protein